MLGSRLRARERPEARQLGQGHVDLHRGAGVADPLDIGHERVGQRVPVEQAQERHVGVGVAGHDGSAILVAARERDADGSAILDEDPRHLRVAADVDAEVACGRRERLGDTAHAAAHVPPHPPCASGLAHDVVEEHVGGSGHRRARHRADDRVGRERPLQLLGLEPAVEDRACGAGEDLHRLAGAVAQPPERASQRQRGPEVAEMRPQQIGRPHREGGLDYRRHPLEHRLVPRIALGVARAELGDLPACQLGISAHQQRAPVGERRERRRLSGQDLVAIRGELQVADDLRVEEAVDVGGGRDLEAWEGLLGHTGAADDVPPLEDHHAQPGTREVARRHEPVVPGADHDGVVTVGCHAGISRSLPVVRRASRSSCARRASSSG